MAKPQAIVENQVLQCFTLLLCASKTHYPNKMTANGQVKTL